jgi:hypothetical protein
LTPQLILRRACAQVAVAERHEQRLRQIADAPDSDDDAFKAELAIARAHRERQNRSYTRLADVKGDAEGEDGKRNAWDAFNAAPRGRRPWDLEGEAVEGEPPAPLDVTDGGQA